MDGFRPAVDGYFDVEDGLSRFLRHRAREGFEREREDKRSIDSRAEFEARRERLRKAFLSAVGGLPDRPGGPDGSGDLPVETTGVRQRERYAVESVVFESLPDFRVTANCYVPEGEGPHPGILLLCGHVEAAKADPYNQKACIELALNGFVVLVIDPVAQGERKQYRDPETGEALVGGGGGVFAHCYAGQQCFFAGANLARWMVHDARRGLDYLAGRPDVDADRIGVAGTSGGGTQTSYLCLLDDRVDAAAPCCAVTERSEWLRTGKRIDVEQALFGAIPRGINYDDLLAAMAPRPVCIGAAASDGYFPIEGVHEAFERTRRVYDLYDAAEDVGLVVADENHCSVYELGDGIFEWLCDHLGDAAFESHDELPVLDRDDLRCTPRGSVRDAYADERSIDDLIREYVAERSPEPVTERSPEAGRDPPADDGDEGGDGDAGGNPTVDDGVQDPEQVRRAVVEKFDLDRAAPEPYPRRVARSRSEGPDVEHVFFKTERDPDVVVTGVLVSDPGAPDRSSADPDVAGRDSPDDGDDPDAPDRAPAAVLYEEGTEALPGRSEEVASLAAEHGTVLVFDPRGVGAVRNRAIPIPNWVEDYYGIYGTEFKLAYDALLLGTSLFGMRVYDVLRALAFLRSETGRERVALVGEGVGAYHALYAAVADPEVRTVDLRDLGPSFREMATGREYPYDPRLTVFDVLGDCDVPRLLAALDDRDLSVERTSG